MCSVNSGHFFRPWNGESLPKSSVESITESDMKCEFDDECTSSSRSNDSPPTGSLDMLSNFVMNSALNQRSSLSSFDPASDCESSPKVHHLKDSCEPCPSIRASPQSAFSAPISSAYADYLSTLRNELIIPFEQSAFQSPHPMYYNLAHYKSMENAVKMIHQQEIAAKQIKKLRPKKFRCEHCDVAFSNNGQLKGHIRIHTGERPFKCDAENCGKSFTRNEELTRHKRIHTGVRPHSCVICGKRFGRKDHLKKHTRTHDNRGHFHLTTSITPFNIGHSTLFAGPPPPHAMQPYIYSVSSDHISF